MSLDLSVSDFDVVRELPDREVRNLRYQITDNDNSVFKRGLKEREQLLRSLLDSVGGPLPDRP